MSFFFYQRKGVEDEEVGEMAILIEITVSHPLPPIIGLLAFYLSCAQRDTYGGGG